MPCTIFAWRQAHCHTTSPHYDKRKKEEEMQGRHLTFMEQEDMNTSHISFSQRLTSAPLASFFGWLAGFLGRKEEEGRRRVETSLHISLPHHHASAPITHGTSSSSFTCLSFACTHSCLLLSPHAPLPHLFCFLSSASHLAWEGRGCLLCMHIFICMHTACTACIFYLSFHFPSPHCTWHSAPHPPLPSSCLPSFLCHMHTLFITCRTYLSLFFLHLCLPCALSFTHLFSLYLWKEEGSEDRRRISRMHAPLCTAMHHISFSCLFLHWEEEGRALLRHAPHAHSPLHLSASLASLPLHASRHAAFACIFASLPARTPALTSSRTSLFRSCLFEGQTHFASFFCPHLPHFAWKKEEEERRAVSLICLLLPLLLPHCTPHPLHLCTCPPLLSSPLFADETGGGLHPLHLFFSLPLASSGKEGKFSPHMPSP